MTNKYGEYDSPLFDRELQDALAYDGLDFSNDNVVLEALEDDEEYLGFQIFRLRDDIYYEEDEE